MHLAILMTNTDESAFSQVWPKDGEKFATMVHERRPDWEIEVFSVKDDVFPEDICAFDGYMITGSPASVHSGEAWVGRLFGAIRQIEAARIPMFGACFGHQAIAMALGGRVEKNPEGWVHGLAEVDMIGSLPFMDETPTRIGLYASHIEQVTKMPEGARAVTRGPGCPVGGFIMGKHVLTSQYHPEMTDEFIADLVEETAEYVGPDVTASARESLKGRADRQAAGEQIVRFFEWAVRG